MSGARRGGIPGPESRTGLVRPMMTEAEFERRQGGPAPVSNPAPMPDGPAGDPVPTDGEPMGRGPGLWPA